MVSPKQVHLHSRSRAGLAAGAAFTGIGLVCMHFMPRHWVPLYELLALGDSPLFLLNILLDHFLALPHLPLGLITGMNDFLWGFLIGFVSRRPPDFTASYFAFLLTCRVALLLVTGLFWFMVMEGLS